MAALDDFAHLSGKVYVGGAFVASRASSQLDVIDPATEERAGTIADCTDAEVDHAIDIANAVRRVWMAMDARSRAVILHDIAALLRRDKALYAECLTREEGKPYKESVDEVSWCATARVERGFYGSCTCSTLPSFDASVRGGRHSRPVRTSCGPRNGCRSCPRRSR